MTTFEDIPLTAITPNPLNPRKHFDGPEFDELVQSIQSKGVIQPILIRPLNEGFEIVAGERRFRAAGKAAENNGGIDRAKIPAVIRELSEDEAFELMTIENLQRKDLTPLEEANSFREYTSRKGKESIADLAEKTGINPRYILRRLAVLTLPKKVLKGWENEKLSFGHLEQLMRLSDKKDILRYYEEITEGYILPTVQRLRANIDNQSPSLNRARFDLEKAGCFDCTQNTDVQKKLWEMDGEKAHCLNPKCFTNHQNNHLLKNWKRTGFYRHHGTKGFRFDHTLSWDDFSIFYGKPPKKCKSCDHFVTIMDICCEAQNEKACVGDKTCFNNQSQSRGSGEGSEKRKKWKPGDGPRVSWHGSHFRDHFYQSALPERMRQIPPDDTKAAQIVLFHLLKQNPEFHGWFITTYDLCEAFDIDKPKGVDDVDERYFRFVLDDNRLFSYISKLDLRTVQEITHQLSIKLTLEHGLYLEDTRGYIAKHAGIDLAGEFEITKEYLQKKTMPEILHMGQSLGIFDDQKAEVFMFEVLGKTNGNYAALKKGQLVRVFLESGVDLKGKVPEEILAIDDEEGENHESTSL